MYVDKWEVLRSYVSGISDNANDEKSKVAENILITMENLDAAEKAERERLAKLA